MSTMTGKLNNADKHEVETILDGLLGKYGEKVKNHKDALDYLLNPKVRDKLLDLILLNPEFKSDITAKVDITDTDTQIEISEKRQIFERKKIIMAGSKKEEQEYTYKKGKIEVFLNCKKETKATFTEYYERDGKKYVIRQIEDINNIVDIKGVNYVIQDNSNMTTIKSFPIVGGKKEKIYGHYYVSSIDNKMDLKRNKNVLLEVTDEGYLKPANFYSEKRKKYRLDNLIFDVKRKNTIVLEDGKKYIVEKIQSTKNKKKKYKKNDINTKTYKLIPLDGSNDEGEVVNISLKDKIIIRKGIKGEKGKISKIKDIEYDYDQQIIIELLNVNAFGEYNKEKIKELITKAYPNKAEQEKKLEEFFSSFSGNNANVHNIREKKEDLTSAYTVLKKIQRIEYIVQDNSLFDLYEKYKNTYEDFSKEYEETENYEKYNEKEVKYEKLKNNLKIIKKQFNDKLEDLGYKEYVIIDPEFKEESFEPEQETENTTIQPDNEEAENTTIQLDNEEAENTTIQPDNEEAENTTIQPDNEEAENTTIQPDNEELGNDSLIDEDMLVKSETKEKRNSDVIIKDEENERNLRRNEQLKIQRKKEMAEKKQRALDFLGVSKDKKTRNKYSSLVKKAMNSSRERKAHSNIYSK